MALLVPLLFSSGLELHYDVCYVVYFAFFAAALAITSVRVRSSLS